MGERAVAPETVESETSLDDLSQDIIDIAELVESIVEQNDRILELLKEVKKAKRTGMSDNTAFVIYGIALLAFLAVVYIFT